MSNESIFLEADNGGIAIYEGAGNRVDWAKDVLALSVVIENWNLLDRDNVFFTSSMDFASEYGFKRNQDARILFPEVPEVILPVLKDLCHRLHRETMCHRRQARSVLSFVCSLL